MNYRQIMPDVIRQMQILIHSDRHPVLILHNLPSNTMHYLTNIHSREKLFLKYIQLKNIEAIKAFYVLPYPETVLHRLFPGTVPYPETLDLQAGGPRQFTDKTVHRHVFGDRSSTKLKTVHRHICSPTKRMLVKLQDNEK